MVQHQGVGYERIDTAALAARKIPLCLCPAGTATGVGEHTMTLILAILKQVVLAHNALVQGRWLQWNAFRTKMRFALGNIQRVVQGEPPLERVPEA
jgi:D-3-phosphoglycerate dehydrogenase